jgi:hypothetical protein
VAGTGLQLDSFSLTRVVCVVVCRVCRVRRGVTQPSGHEDKQLLEACQRLSEKDKIFTTFIGLGVDFGVQVPFFYFFFYFFFLLGRALTSRPDWWWRWWGWRWRG